MKFDPMEYLLAKGVDEQTASDWLDQRKLAKAIPSLTAINRLEKQANQAGMALTEALETCCMNGWRGFRAEWVAPRQTFTDRKVDTLNQLTGRTSNVVDFAQGRLLNVA